MPLVFLTKLPPEPVMTPEVVPPLTVRAVAPRLTVPPLRVVIALVAPFRLAVPADIVPMVATPPTVVVPPEMPSVKLDFVFMEHVLANLLSNAAQYSPAGSEITVAAQLDGSNLILKVVDEGRGIAPEAGNRIFEKFYRGPNARPGGTGLGLSIIRGLMHALGGEVTNENNPGRGTTFTLRIPVETAVLPEGLDETA